MASHHPTIDPILPELRDALSYLAPAAPKIPLVSHRRLRGVARRCSARTTGWPTCATRCGSARRCRRRRRARTFIEISPHPLLTHAIGDTLGAQETSRKFHVGATVNRDNHETVAFHAQLAAVRPPAVRRPGRDSQPGLADVPADAWQHTAYWMADRSAGREFAGAHPLAGPARRTAVGQRPRLAVRRGSGSPPVARRPHRARPAGHAGRRLRRDRAGRGLRGARPARHRCRGPGRGRADAAAGPAHRADHPADPRRDDGRDARRDPLPLGRGHVDPARQRQGPCGGIGHTRAARRRVRGQHRGVAVGLLHRAAAHRRPSRPRVRGADPHRPEQRRLGGHRDRAARGSDAAPRHRAAPGHARRRAAGPGGRDERRNPFER